MYVKISTVVLGESRFPLVSMGGARTPIGARLTNESSCSLNRLKLAFQKTAGEDNVNKLLIMR